MIPKILHYCWFGGKEKPAEFHKWYETWLKAFPDYEIMEWNEGNFDVNICPYSAEAYRTGNYAFVSDVCRIHALYKFGGVYLDTDVEVIKPFGPLMELDSFVGVESDLVGMAVVGAMPQMKWTEEFMNFYRRTHFINSWGHTVRTPNTKILTRRILPKTALVDYPTILPVDYFNGKTDAAGKRQPTERTVAIHHFAASWRRKKTAAERIRNIITGLQIRYSTLFNPKKNRGGKVAKSK